MKKLIALIAAMTLLLALFAACGDKTQTPPVDSAAQASEEPSATDDSTAVVAPTDVETEEPVEESPYNFAVDKYEVDTNGYPVSTYEYELPLTTTGETFSYWTTCFNPTFIPEDGYESIEYYQGFEEYTGVNIEYMIVPYETMSENFRVLLAADDLCDLSSQGIYHYSGGSTEQSIEDGYFVNIYDYKEYCPNFMYYAVNYDPADERTRAAVFLKPDIITAFYSLYDGYYTSIDIQARGDWLTKLGLTNDDIVTYDDVYNMLVMMKSEFDTCEYPYAPWFMIDSTRAFISYDTMIYVTNGSSLSFYVVDGQIKTINVGDNGKALMTVFNKWWQDGLVDPDYASYNSSMSAEYGILNSEIGFTIMHSSENGNYESRSIDPDVTWVPIKKPLITEGQMLHYNCWKARTSIGLTTISGTCSNIELAITWMDWKYSPFGADYAAWGPEGAVWEYDESGEKMCTDWALNHPDGLGFTWVLKIYGYNVILDGGIEIMKRNFAYPGGGRYYEISNYWNDIEYDSANDISPMFKLTTEETNAVLNYQVDVATYENESLPQFFDGSKPLSEWEDYVETLNEMGLVEILAIYQAAYDDFIANG